jgi:hypothetical protein
VHGDERRAIAEIDGHRAQDHLRARVQAGLDDVVQVPSEMSVSDFLPWIARINFALGEHLHPTPRRGPRRTATKFPRQRHDPLAGARSLEGEVPADELQRRRLLAENGRGAERADHLVVPHVNDPQVAVMSRALAGDGQDRMRVDRGHRDADDLEPGLRKPFAQERLEVTSHAKRRPRIAQRGGFAEDEDAKRARGFLRVHDHRRRAARGFRRKKPETELVVLDEDFPAADGGSLKKIRGGTVAHEAQDEFQRKKHDERGNDRREKAEEPQASPRERRGRAAFRTSVVPPSFQCFESSGARTARPRVSLECAGKAKRDGAFLHGRQWSTFAVRV